jgi:hypothetical protein
METSLWHGNAPETASRLPLVGCSSNGGKALAFNWPRAPRGEGRVIVSRLLGMSLCFDADVWHQQGFNRFDARLHVHHADDVHFNNFMDNLEVTEGGPHVGEHNRRR